MKSLSEKVVWIIGASSGIGKELAFEFSRKGAKLILSARNESKLNEVNETMPVAPGSARILPLDLELLDELPSKTHSALSFYDTIDILVLNAGVAVRDWAAETNKAVDEKLMRINYFGPIIITKSLLPHLLEKGNKHIAVTSSLSGKYGVPKTSSYAASKHALHGFFETLRSETFDKGINITIIVPGIIKTGITAHALTGKGRSYGKIETSFETAYPADRAAKKYVNAILKHKEETFIGGTEGITLLINRLSPWLLRRFIRNHPIKRMRKFMKMLGLKIL